MVIDKLIRSFSKQKSEELLREKEWNIQSAVNAIQKAGKIQLGQRKTSLQSRESGRSQNESQRSNFSFSAKRPDRNLVQYEEAVRRSESPTTMFNAIAGIKNER